MASLTNILNNEIRRLARKEIRAEYAATKKSSAQHRRDIAALKRELRDQARTINALERAIKTVRAGSDDGPATARFSPKWLRAHREKLELSASDYAALVGVSPLTIYNWEKGKTRPRQQQVQAWSAIRKLGKREAWRRLDDLE
jgi:DNA-binding transcriptional regulator YiaG